MDNFLLTISSFVNITSCILFLMEINCHCEMNQELIAKIQSFDITLKYTECHIKFARGLVDW